MSPKTNRPEGGSSGAVNCSADERRQSNPFNLGQTKNPDRAGSSRRLDPVTHMHWNAAEADTALATCASSSASCARWA